MLYLNKSLYINFNYMWPCILESCKGEERTNLVRLSWSLLMIVTQHVSGIIMPIIRSTRRDDKPHTVFWTGCAVVDLRRWGGSCVHLMAVVMSYNHSHQVHTGSTSSPKVHSARPVQNTVCGLSSFTVFLMMGIMMLETCWVTNINKLQLNCI
jgi:hypothetical protein